MDEQRIFELIEVLSKNVTPVYGELFAMLGVEIKKALLLLKESTQREDLYIYREELVLNHFSNNPQILDDLRNLFSATPYKNANKMADEIQKMPYAERAVLSNIIKNKKIFL